MIAKEVMTNTVLAIAPDTPLAQAIRLMSEHHISGLPVIGPGGRIVGILTEGDLLRRTEIDTVGKAPGWFAGLFLPGRAAQKYVLTHGRRVDEVMTTDVITVAPAAPLSEIVELMTRYHVKRIPVTQDGRVVGIVSRADIVREVGRVLSAEPEARTDAAIRRAITQAMDRQTWSPGKMISITVKDGDVQLDGCLCGMRERTALGVLAENVPGVKSVENRIVCIETYTGMVIYDPNADIPEGETAPITADRGA